MNNILLLLMGYLALNPVLRNIENSLRIDEKRIMFFINTSEHIQYFRKRIFAIGWRFIIPLFFA